MFWTKNALENYTVIEFSEIVSLEIIQWLLNFLKLKTLPCNKIYL